MSMSDASVVRPLPTVMAAFLEAILNRWLAASSEPAMARLGGRSIAVEIQPPGLGLVFLGAADRLQVLGTLDGEDADVTVVGSPLGLAAALSGDGRSMVHVHGDAAVLTDLQRALSGVSFDCGEWLEAVAGAGTAGPLLRAGETVRGHVRRFVERGLEDTADYVCEEARWLPPAGEFEALSEDLAAVRDDTARLEARIARLEAALGAAPSATGPGFPGPG